MNLSFDEASRGFIQCAAWVGQTAAGEQVVGIFKLLRSSYPALAPQLSTMMINTYGSIVAKHGARIHRDGFSLPGYVAPAVVAHQPVSDAEMLRILKPYYDEFISSHAG